MNITVQLMTPNEALLWKTEFEKTANRLRTLLNEGYERAAWSALGFLTWTDCLKSLSDEFGYSERRLWQLHAANQIEVNITTEQVSVGSIPEAHLRPLTALEPAEQQVVWEQVLDTAPNGKITAAHVQAVVSEYYGGESIAIGEQQILGRAQEIRQAKLDERRKERADRIVAISSGNRLLDGSIGLFPVILADPPWQYEHSMTDNRRIENHYPTMTLSEICQLPVSDVATRDAALFLWTTSPKLAEALQVINAWGFTYRSCIVWDKERIGMGYYARQQHEFFLICARGSLPVPEPQNRPSSVQRIRRDNEHSVKPVEFYEIVERMYPEYAKLELFCRAPRAGWSAWGNQI